MRQKHGEALASGEAEVGTDGPFAGMTVNERLEFAGLRGAWWNAVNARDREAMLAIMRKVEVETPEDTVDAVLTDLSRHQY